MKYVARTVAMPLSNAVCNATEQNRRDVDALLKKDAPSIFGPPGDDQNFI
jgi:hypothetical protein